MKLSKEELIQRINDLAIDDDIKISLMEDVTDSFETSEEVDMSGYVEKTKYDELAEKYKARFLEGEKKEETEEKKEEETEEEPKEEEVIDVKEI